MPSSFSHVPATAHQATAKATPQIRLLLSQPHMQRDMILTLLRPHYPLPHISLSLPSSPCWGPDTPGSHLPARMYSLPHCGFWLPLPPPSHWMPCSSNWPLMPHSGSSFYPNVNLAPLTYCFWNELFRKGREKTQKRERERKSLLFNFISFRRLLYASLGQSMFV